MQTATAASAISVTVERLTLRARRNPAPERVDLGLASDLRPDHQREQGERRHLDAAAGRGAPGADEHERRLREQRLVRHLRRSRPC